MSLPFATRCAMQALRESGDERAQDAYALIVQAFVSGDPQDIKVAEQALSETKGVRFEGLKNIPATCENEVFRSIHSSAVTTASKCGVSLPDTVLSDQLANGSKMSVAYVTVIVVMVLLCVVAHAWFQRCKPAAMCAASR